VIIPDLSPRTRVVGLWEQRFCDQPISIHAHAHAHADWSEQERLDAGGMTTPPERMVAAFAKGEPINSLVVDMSAMEGYQDKSSPYFVNSENFANESIKNDPEFMGKVLLDHAFNDWRDVLQHKVDIPVAIFSGEYSNNLPSQRWMASVLPSAALFAFTKPEHGNHLLMFKNPQKLTDDLIKFLER